MALAELVQVSAKLLIPLRTCVPCSESLRRSTEQQPTISKSVKTCKVIGEQLLIICASIGHRGLHAVPWAQSQGPDVVTYFSSACGGAQGV